MRKYSYIPVILFFLGIITFLLYHFSFRQDSEVNGYQHLIGLSLPNATISRNRQLIEQVDHHRKENNTVNFLVKEAQDSAIQQLKDINELEALGIDLLVLSPIQDEIIRHKLTKLQIPFIILHDRYEIDFASGYIYYDNHKAGNLLANYLARNISSDVPILLLSGNREPLCQDREAGFLEKLPNPQRLTTISCDWNQNSAENAMKYHLVAGNPVDVVVAFNDQMAYGAYLAGQKLRSKDILFFGMNGFAGKDKGQELIQKKILNGSITFEDMYASILRISLSILHHQPYDKETKLDASLLLPGK